MKTYVVHKNSSFIATGSVSWYIYGIFQAILRGIQTGDHVI